MFVMLSKEASSTLIKSPILPSSSSYWKSNVKGGRFTDQTDHRAMRSVKVFDNNILQLEGLWISNDGGPIEECACCCSSNSSKDGWLSFCADKTPSTVASSPPSKSRPSPETFSLKQSVRFEPTVRVRFCNKAESNSDECTPTSPSPFSDSKTPFPLDELVDKHRSAFHGEPQTAPSEWQGIVLETECVLKDFDGHSALRDKTYSSCDDLEEMAHLMGIEPPRSSRYGRERSETIYDLEEYMDSLPDKSRSRSTYRATTATASSYRLLKGDKGRCDTQYSGSDSDEDILARMESMGCDLDLADE